MPVDSLNANRKLDVSVASSAAPLASVLMLAYNHEPYIAESIECILNQKTSFPFELIIGEDCSPDRTKEIALKYERLHPGVVRVISSTKNVGMHENARRLELAFRGRYVALCEGDDYWHDPDKLKQQVQFLENNPDYVMVHTDYRRHFVKSGLKTRWTVGVGPKMDDSDAYNDMLRRNRKITTLTVCVRGETFRRVLREAPECYDSRFLMGDTQRWFEIARHGSIKYFPKVMATRRILPESATRSRDPAKVLRMHLSSKDVIDHYAQKYPACPKAADKARALMAISVVDYAYAARNLEVVNAMFEELENYEIRIPIATKIKFFALRRPQMRWMLNSILLCFKATFHFRRIIDRLRDHGGPMPV